MYRGYIVYGLIVLAWFAYAQYHGWSLGSDYSGSSSRGGGWHWSWGGSSGSGGSWGGGGFHK